MQTQTQQRFNPRSFIGIAAVATGLGIMAHFGGQMWAAQPATIAPQVAEPVQVDTAEQPVALTLDALLFEVVAMVGMPSVGDATEAAIETRWGAQTYTNGSAECVYSILDKLGLTNCGVSTDRFMETCRQFYSADHCANRMQPGMEQAPTSYQQAGQPQAVALYPNRPLNYVPEHWGPGIQAALQYPAGLAAQQWANEHLYQNR